MLNGDYLWAAFGISYIISADQLKMLLNQIIRTDCTPFSEPVC